MVSEGLEDYGPLLRAIAIRNLQDLDVITPEEADASNAFVERLVDWVA